MWMGQCERERERGMSDKERETVSTSLHVQDCMCSVESSEPNLTTDLARASGAREKALLTTNSLSVRLSHTHICSKCLTV